MINETLLTSLKELKGDGKNFQTIKKEIGEDRLKEFFNIIYPQFNITEIETITGISDSTLERWFNELGIPLIRNHITNISIPGDINSEIILKKDNIVKKVSTIKITPELAYIIGFTLGDGSVQRYMVEVFNKDKKLKGILYEYLKPYGTITEEERANGLWRLRLSSVKIANLIKENKQIRKDTLDYIFNNEELVKRFIAAFWDAEGTVRRQGNYYHLYVYNSNKYLIDKICNFLNIKNIKYSIHSRKTRDKNAILAGRIVKSKKILYRICVHKSSYLGWIKEVGLYLNHSKKRKEVNQIIKLLGGN